VSEAITRPQLSVVVPAHNAASTIRDCLVALLASDLERSRWELIVVDDGSTDDTGVIAAALADYVLATGPVAKGPAFARNRGADAARSANIAFIDADVSVHPDALRLMVEVLDGDFAFAAVVGSYDDAPRDPSAVSQYRNLLHHYVHNKNAGETATFWAGCGGVKKEFFDRAGKFDEKKYPRPQIEDIELGYRLRTVGARIVIDPRIQCSHHKSWNTLSMVRTDLRDRGIPWVKLLLSSPDKGNSPSPSLGGREIFGTMAIGTAVVFAILTLTRYSTFALVGLAVSVALSVWINRDLYRWFIQKRGAGFATRAVPLHFLYQLVSGVAVPLGVASYVSESWLPRSRADDEESVSFRRFAPLAGGEILSRVIAFVATAYLARILGVTGFGQIAFAAAVVAQFGTALAAGIGEVGSREIARAPARMRQIAAGGALARLLGSMVAVSFVLVLTVILPLDPAMKRVTALSTLLLIPLALDTGWVYKGAGKTRRIGWALLVDQAVSLALIVLFINDATKVTTVPVLQALGDMTASVFLAIPLLRGRWKLPDRAAVSELPRQSGLITVSRSLRTIIVSFDVILLGLMIKPADVGLYSAAYRIVFFVMAIVYASHVAFLPAMSRSGLDKARMSSILSRAIGLSVTVALPFVVGGWLVAPGLMALIFGEAYRGGAVALQLLLVSILFIAIHGTTRNVFLARERLGAETTIVGIGVVTNIILNLILIPRLGITGAAAATLIGEGVILVLALGSVLVMGLRPAPSRTVPPVIATTGLALAMTAYGLERPVVATIAIGAVTYVVILFAAQSLFRKAAPSTFAEAGA
jgi:O-antigen/teichoic acid export membrane protein/glycosyltransferase involved in cell wall biosynthesis